MVILHIEFIIKDSKSQLYNVEFVPSESHH